MERPFSACACPAISANVYQTQREYQHSTHDSGKYCFDLYDNQAQLSAQRRDPVKGEVETRGSNNLEFI